MMITPTAVLCMFSLDRTKNNSSTMLDLFRAVSAQVVCIGHAWNLTYENGTPFQLIINDSATYLPYVGVIGLFYTFRFCYRSHAFFKDTLVRFVQLAFTMP